MHGPHVLGTQETRRFSTPQQISQPLFQFHSFCKISRSSWLIFVFGF